MSAASRPVRRAANFGAATVIAFVTFYALSLLFLYALGEVAYVRRSGLAAFCVSVVIAVFGMVGAYIGTLCIKRGGRFWGFVIVLCAELIYCGIYVGLSTRGRLSPLLGRSQWNQGVDLGAKGPRDSFRW